MVRAKVTLKEIKTSETGCNGRKYGETKTFVFQPVHDPSLTKDRLISTMTPWGNLEMQVENPTATTIEQLKLGSTFFLDIVPEE